MQHDVCVCVVHNVWSIVPECLSYLTNDASFVSDIDTAEERQK